MRLRDERTNDNPKNNKEIRKGQQNEKEYRAKKGQ